MLIIKNGRIHNGIDEVPFIADILMKDGKIAQINQGIEVIDAEIYDANGYDVYPGFIDVHTHIGMFGFSGEATKDDVEKYDNCTPNHRALDAVNIYEETFLEAAKAGVTCACIGPGSVACMAGSHMAVKTYGENRIVADPVAMKIAFGENLKKTKVQTLTTRATVAATIREIIQRAKEYDKKIKNDEKYEYDPKLEALLCVVRGEIPLKAHAHRKDDILTAIRIAEECGVKLTLEHTTESEGIEDLLFEKGYPIAVGPYFYQPKKAENRMSSPKNAVRLIEKGCRVSVMTDSPIVATQYLPASAALLMREGLSEFEALKTITINPARHLGIENRVGSIEIGKDADLVICKGCPLQITVKPTAVFINGEKI